MIETMTVDGNGVSDPIEPGSAEDRLDGWKRIANYLNRDVRTLRRWELNEGLPVHRLMHDKQGTVYAFRSELDAWRSQRGEETSSGTTVKSPHTAGKSVSKWVWLSIPVLILATVLTWYWSAEQKPAVGLGEWDWVLITQFENRTGEEVLDDTVEYALQRVLANSQFVKVVPQERINDALRLMKLPGDTYLDLEAGREISLRDGAIKMLVTGRVEKLGMTYLISIQLFTPADGVTVASFSAEANGQEQILSRIEGLAEKVRAALGEGMASIAESSEMLARVTTPSLEALRLYSQANLAMAGPDRVSARALLDEAVRHDPEFASAHLLL